jgi:hypothetical protein
MNEKIKKYFDLFPIVVPAIYILGYIVVNGYLSNYNFSDYNILNLTYLKAGILYSFLITIIFITMKLSFIEDTMTDNLKKSWPSLLIATANILFITTIFSFFIIDFKDLMDKDIKAFKLFGVCFILYILFRIWMMGKKPKNKLGVVVLIVPQIIFTLIILLIFCHYFNTVKDILFFNSGLALIIFLALGDFGDKNYSGKIVTDVILLIVFSFFFGKNIYGNLPFKFGGGQQYEIVVAKCKPINEIVNQNQTLDTLSVIYENDSRILINDKKKNTIFIDKSEIKAYKILK